MSKTSNAVKAVQLGMPLGTAMGRLRKTLLFHAVQKLGEDLCYKCHLRIARVEDFSVEHKQPWLHVSPDLFWDVNNIAYSHIGCNRPDRPNGGGQYLRIKSPEGMNWCNRHKKFLPVAQFSQNRNHFTGLHTLCKECQHYNRNFPLEGLMRDITDPAPSQRGKLLR